MDQQQLLDYASRFGAAWPLRWLTPPEWCASSVAILALVRSRGYRLPVAEGQLQDLHAAYDTFLAIQPTVYSNEVLRSESTETAKRLNSSMSWLMARAASLLGRNATPDKVMEVAMAWWYQLGQVLYVTQREQVQESFRDQLPHVLAEMVYLLQLAAAQPVLMTNVLAQHGLLLPPPGGGQPGGGGQVGPAGGGPQLSGGPAGNMAGNLLGAAGQMAGNQIAGPAGGAVGQLVGQVVGQLGVASNPAAAAGANYALQNTQIGQQLVQSVNQQVPNPPPVQPAGQQGQLPNLGVQPNPPPQVPLLPPGGQR